MKNMKKLLALLLAIVMVMGMFPVGTLAQEREHDHHAEGCTGAECTLEDCTCRCHYRHLESCKEGCTGELSEGELCECDCHFVHLDTCLEECTGMVEVEGQQQECACECHDHIDVCVENCVGETKEGEDCACTCHHTVETCSLDCADEECACDCHKAATLNLEKKEPEKCATCQSTEHTTENHPEGEAKDETKCATCQSTEHTTENHPAEPAKCSICQAAHRMEECTLYCGFCKGYPCTCDKCTECGVNNDHTSTCTKRPCETCKKNPCECVKTCETCKKDPCECAKPCETCKKDPCECTKPCETCNKAPCECPTTCADCGAQLTENTIHAADCPSLCNCEENFEIHGAECPLADGEAAFAYYEKKLKDLQKEAASLADGLNQKEEDYADKLMRMLEDYVSLLMEYYGDSYYYFEEDVFTSEQDEALMIIVEDVLAELFDLYGYDYQTGILTTTLLDQLNAQTSLEGYDNVLKNVNMDTVTGIEWGDVNTHIAAAYTLYAKDPENSTNKAHIQNVSKKLYEIRDRIEKAQVKPVDGISTISGIVENDNVNIHLFNYGKQINTQQSGMGFLPFSQGSYETYKRNPFVYTTTKNNVSTNNVSYEDMSEIDGEAPGNSSSPRLSKTLVNGYPYVTENRILGADGKDASEAQIKKGSLQYLFDKTLGQATRDTGKSVWNGATLITNSADRTSNVAYTYNSANSYAVSHYTVKAGDSGLFKDAGGYYYYNSIDNAAWFNEQTGKFEVYNTTVIPKYITYRTNTSGSTGNFLPFNRISADTVGKVTNLMNLKEPVTQDGKTTYQSIVRSWTEEGAAEVYLLQEQGKSEIDLWFGISADFSFLMPENGYRDGQPMVYEFFGDDDVFVYIDGVLILSIGGCHAPFNGSINFATGDVRYEQIMNYDEAAESGVTRETKEVINTNLKTLYQDAYDSLTAAEKESPMGLKIKRVLDNGFVEKTIDGKTNYIFKDFTRHDFDFFYLERGGNISAMKMKFNLDPIPSAGITLTKEVDGKNSAIEDNVEYTFEITAVDADENVLSAINYYIDEDGQLGKTLNTVYPNAQQKFVLKLKDGQTARFDGLNAGVRMSFTENADSHVTSATSWEKDGEEYTAGDKFVISPDVSVEVKCKNTRITSNLSVKKILEGIQCAPDDKFPMEISFDSTLYTGDVKITKDGAEVDEDRKLADTCGVYLLKAGEVLTIDGIPTDYSYTVTELDPNNVAGNSDYGYLYKEEDTDTLKEYPLYNNAEGTITAGTTSEVTVTNKHAVADLKIIKEVDLPAVDAGQTFLFLVEGPADYKQYVVIQGSGSKAITKLPVGEYSVTELTDWSWRYELDPAEPITLVTGIGKDIDGSTVSFRLTNADEAVTFKNKRNENLWLDGNAYCDNAFTR